MTFKKSGSWALTTVAAALLVACGGGGGGGTAGASGTSVTVSPSLGKFSAGAVVILKKLDGTEIGRGTTDSTGKAAITLSASYSGAFIVEVQGAPGVTFYDEGSDTNVSFGTGETLKAIVPSVRTAVGVTSASNAAFTALSAANGGNIVNVTPETIKLHNAKLESALGVQDVLQAPKLVGAKSDKLDIADLGDKYALKLAALAKLASGGKNALDVAKSLANDLKDGKVDGNDGTTPLINLPYTHSTFSIDMAAKLKLAADDFGNTDTKTLVNADPSVAGEVNTDVSTVTPPPTGTSSDDVSKAKALFAELRTTMGSFFGSGGFTDTQGTRINSQVNNYVAPAIERVVYRLGVLGNAVKVYEGTAQGSEDLGLVVNSGGTPFYFKRQEGNLVDLWNGNSSTFHVCGTPDSPRTKVVCLVAHSGGPIYKATATTGSIRFVKYVVEPTVGGAYSYTNTIVTGDVTAVNDGGLVFATNNFAVDTNVAPQSGTITRTGSPINSYAVEGYFTPSTQASGPDQVSVTGTRSLVSGTVYRNDLTGTVTTPNKNDSTKKVVISLNSGSFVKVDDSKKNSNQGDWIQEMDLSLSAEQQTQNKLSGRLQVSGFAYGVGQTGWSPSRVEFTGKLFDLAGTAPTTAILDGSLVATQTSASQTAFNEALPQSDTNFRDITMTLTGMVNNPARPQMKVVMAAHATGFEKGTATFTYTYDAVRMTGSVTTNGSNSSAMTLSNQDGLQLAKKVGDGTTVELKKSTTLLASFKNGVISYVDGVTESLGTLLSRLGNNT